MRRLPSSRRCGSNWAASGFQASSTTRSTIPTRITAGAISPTPNLTAWGYANVEQFRAAFIAKWSKWLDDNRIGATWFSFDWWNQPTVEEAKRAGYGYNDLPDVLTAFTEQNAIHTFKGALPTMPTAPTVVAPPPGWDADVFIMTVTTSGLNLRSNVDVSASNVIRTMALGESVKAWRIPLTPSTDGKYLMAYVQDAQGNRGYAATHAATNGAPYFSPSVEPVVLLPPIGDEVVYSAAENAALHKAFFDVMASYEQLGAQLDALGGKLKGDVPPTATGGF